MAKQQDVFRRCTAVTDRQRALDIIAAAWLDWNVDHIGDAPNRPEDSAPNKGDSAGDSDYDQLALDRSATAEQNVDYAHRTEEAEMILRRIQRGKTGEGKQDNG